jgi:cell division protein FtsI/penicillin-binding protein 2
MASAIEEKLVTPSTSFYDAGVVVKYGWPIRNWDGKGNGTITMTQVLQKSLNTGAIWVAQMIGPERFYEYVRRFGFGESTHVGMGGEAVGLRSDEEPVVRGLAITLGQDASLPPDDYRQRHCQWWDGAPIVVEEISGEASNLRARFER